MEVISNGDSRQAASGRAAGSRHMRSNTHDFASPKMKTVETIQYAANEEAQKQNLTANKDGVHRATTVSAFDPLSHKVPRLDRFGFNEDPMNARNMLQRASKNILAETVNIPKWWQEKRIAGTVRQSLEASKTARATPEAVTRLPNDNRSKSFAVSTLATIPEKMTRTQLIENRKREALPDLSYDIDGDGFVGGRDYVVARRFDQGQKNFLTDEERQKLFEALGSGYEEKFVWNVEASGSMRPFRLMQKRGVMVDADDYSKVTGTYPEHPIHSHRPKFGTSTELKDHRKSVEKLDIKGKKDANDAKIASIKTKTFKDYYQPQEYVPNPRYTATWQKTAEQKLNTRAEHGLKPIPDEVNHAKLPNPSLYWVDKPLVVSKSLLVEKKKQDHLRDQQKFEKNFESHVDGQGRIEERENCIARITFKGLDTVTMNKQVVKDRRTQEMIEDMTKKFGNQVLGVHGAELPKFAGHPTDQFYWTMQKSFNKSPRCQSLNLLKQSQKYWAVNDQMKLADTTGDLGPQDPFKAEHHKKKSKFTIMDKVNHSDLWKPSDQIGNPEFRPKWMPAIKWSESEKNKKCEGADRHQRTFSKIVDRAIAADTIDAERTKKMEEVIIKQAPRSLQVELAQQIQAEKAHEASLVIGTKRNSQPAGNRFKNNSNGQSQHELASQPTINKKEPSNFTGSDGGKGSVTPIDKDRSPLNSVITKSGAQIGSKAGQPQDSAKVREMNAISTLLSTQTMGIPSNRGGSLLARVASPIHGDEKAKKTGELFASTLGTTAQATAIGQSQMSMPSQNSQRVGHASMFSHHSSPFQKTITRTMMTGVGFLGK